jgi:hypothetical protein
MYRRLKTILQCRVLCDVGTAGERLTGPQETPGVEERGKVVGVGDWRNSSTANEVGCRTQYKLSLG